MKAKPKNTGVGMSDTKAREWTIFDGDEYGPAWNGPRFEPTKEGIKVREVRAGEVCITREELRTAWDKVARRQMGNHRISVFDVEREIFGEAKDEK